MAKRRAGLARRLLRGLFVALAAWVVVTVVAVVAFRWIDPATTMFMAADRIDALLKRDATYRFRHDWVDGDAISRQAALAVIASEDQQFPRHHGFDFKQIDKAFTDRS